MPTAAHRIFNDRITQQIQNTYYANCMTCNPQITILYLKYSASLFDTRTDLAYFFGPPCKYISHNNKYMANVKHTSTKHLLCCGMVENWIVLILLPATEVDNDTVYPLLQCSLNSTAKYWIGNHMVSVSKWSRWQPMTSAQIQCDITMTSPWWWRWWQW